jgi:hypothetical protein
LEESVCEIKPPQFCRCKVAAEHKNTDKFADANLHAEHKNTDKFTDAHLQPVSDLAVNKYWTLHNKQLLCLFQRTLAYY